MKAEEYLQSIRDKYCEIAALTARLHPDSPVEEFEDTIRIRKGILIDIEQCRQALEKRFPDWRQDPQARTRAADIQSIIQHIVNTDNYAKEMLQKNMKKVGDDLRMLRRTSTAARGYARQASFKAA